MLNQQTTDQLRALKLTGMLEAWEQQREQPRTMGRCWTCYRPTT